MSWQKFRSETLEIRDHQSPCTQTVNAVIDTPDLSNLRVLAVHEAGHASCATNLGLVVEAIEIDGLDGYSYVADLDRARPSIQLAILSAGAAAERGLTGRKMESRPHENSDAQRIADVLRLVDRRERAAVMAQAEQMAKRLVWVHRGTIFKVATALLQQCSSAGQPQARLDGDALSDALGGPAVVAILRAAARPRDA